MAAYSKPFEVPALGYCECLVVKVRWHPVKRLSDKDLPGNGHRRREACGSDLRQTPVTSSSGRGRPISARNACRKARLNRCRRSPGCAAPLRTSPRAPSTTPPKERAGRTHSSQSFASLVGISISDGSTPSAFASFLIVLHLRGRGLAPSSSQMVDVETPAALAKSRWLRNFRSRNSRSVGMR
jgi:hypothetical protein